MKHLLESLYILFQKFAKFQGLNYWNLHCYWPTIYGIKINNIKRVVLVMSKITSIWDRCLCGILCIGYSKSDAIYANIYRYCQYLKPYWILVWLFFNNHWSHKFLSHYRNCIRYILDPFPISMCLVICSSRAAKTIQNLFDNWTCSTVNIPI